MPNRRRFLALASAGLAMPALGGRAFADVWPKDKAIHAKEIVANIALAKAAGLKFK
jgi:hypothetical protein